MEPPLHHALQHLAGRAVVAHAEEALVEGQLHVDLPAVLGTRVRILRADEGDPLHRAHAHAAQVNGAADVEPGNGIVEERLGRELVLRGAHAADVDDRRRDQGDARHDEEADLGIAGLVLAGHTPTPP